MTSRPSRSTAGQCARAPRGARHAAVRGQVVLVLPGGSALGAHVRTCRALREAGMSGHARTRRIVDRAPWRAGVDPGERVTEHV